MYHSILAKRTPKRRSALIPCIMVLMVILLHTSLYAQDHHKLNRKYQKAHHFKRNETRLLKACSILERKRHQSPWKALFAFHRSPKISSGTGTGAGTGTEKSVIKIDRTQVVADASGSKPVIKKMPITPKIEQISAEKLLVLHKKEDEVLATNNLPVPTSKVHEQVRKRVSDKLASKVNVYPLALDPLYFQFNQDEFSVVDMEPFLIAAEYAMQGRTVLIEGHTDARGKDDFNVKLSIKRVQKIRQLMLDMGVPDDRISVVGYGEELGKQKVVKESDHQVKRRVDFTIF